MATNIIKFANSLLDINMARSFYSPPMNTDEHRYDLDFLSLLGALGVYKQLIARFLTLRWDFNILTI